MDQAAKDRIQHELEDEAKNLFPGAVRRAVLLQHGDDPLVEPGELVLRLVITPPPGEDGELPEPGTVLRRPAMKQFRHELSRRLPGCRRIEVMLEDASGHPLKGHFMMTTDEGARLSDGDFTPVMARLRAAELEIVDTLISAGIAANRAEAVRWALARISERPAYAQLREHTRDIERLKTEF
ncbi:MAG TPA: hypothetical protein VIX86_13180 [Streptosporangiaceae bacterium]